MKRARVRWRLTGLPVAVLALFVLGGCVEPPVKLPNAPVLAAVKTVAVWPFIDAPGETSKGSGQVVVNAAIAALYKCPGVQVIERSRLDVVAKEHDVTISAMASADEAAKIGKLAGVDAIILGEVTQYEAQQEYGHFAVDVVSGGRTKRIHRVGLGIRMVTVADSKIVFCESGQGTSEKGFDGAAREAATDAFDQLRRFYEQTNAPKK